MEHDDYNLEDLKKDFEKLQKKYQLPGFLDLNKDFEVEKIDGKETELLSREVRRAMVEKNLAYLRFVESFLNPSAAPFFCLALFKSVSAEDRKLMEEIYFKLAKYELESVMLDNIYNEEKDAEFIKKLHKDWQDVKIKFDRIMNSLVKGLDKKLDKKDSGYLG